MIFTIKYNKYRVFRNFPCFPRAFPPVFQERGDEEELEDMATDGDELALRELAWRNAQADGMD